MRKWIFIVLSYIILAGAIVVLAIDKGEAEDNWKTATANVKAYDELLSSSRNKSVSYQLTIDQLNYVKDSILQELKKTQKELKVKNSNVKSMQYITTTVEKVDTIILQDTVFYAKVNMDTTIQDNWYKLRMKLSYPDTIIVSPSFKSEKNIIISSRKETVNPPKKLWILRLFQKKHKVLQVDVVEKNPYAINNESRYVEVIK